MSYHFFMVDITRHVGDSRPVINAARTYIAMKFRDPSLEWIARSNQVALLAGEKTVHELVSENELLPLVRNIIFRPSSNGSAPPSVFHVVTYEKYLLELASGLNDGERVVVPHHMIEILKNVPLQPSHKPTDQYGVAGIGTLSLEDRHQTRARHSTEGRALF